MIWTDTLKLSHKTHNLCLAMTLKHHTKCSFHTLILGYPVNKINWLDMRYFLETMVESGNDFPDMDYRKKFQATLFIPTKLCWERGSHSLAPLILKISGSSPGHMPHRELASCVLGLQSLILNRQTPHVYPCCALTSDAQLWLRQENGLQRHQSRDFSQRKMS